MSNICVVIPAHNEEKTIRGLVEGVRRQGLDVVVVDDGSLDSTASLARAAGALVMVNPRKRGKGASLKRGFAHVLKENYEAVITMDGDGQHDPSDLAAFLREAQKDPERVITGNRMGAARGMPWVRYWTNRFMSAMISVACGQTIPDTQCGYRYIGRGVLHAIYDQLSCSGFEVETEILMKASRRGVKVCSVPIQTIYRGEKSKINPLRDTVRFISYFIKELAARS